MLVSKGIVNSAMIAFLNLLTKWRDLDAGEFMLFPLEKRAVGLRQQ